MYKQSAAAAVLMAVAGSATAGGTIKIDDTRSVTVGAGFRTSFNSVEDAAPSGEDRSQDFALDSIRLYVSGTLHDNIDFEFNTEREASGDIRVLDGVAKFKVNEQFNVWAGRFLPPSDRSNLSGPYYLGIWDFPAVQAFPAIFAGRDDGLAVWGQTGGGQFKYQVGVFDGPATPEDKLLVTGRVVVNLLDTEPGYYNSSTYFGTKDIFAIGATVQSQDGDTAFNLDVLFEKKTGNGSAITLEGAFYDYDQLGGIDGDGDGVAVEGDGFFVLGGYLFPKVGKDGGQFKPVIRFTDGEFDGVEGDRFDIGLDYILNGHNARFSLLFGDADGVFGDGNVVRVGFQGQI